MSIAYKNVVSTFVLIGFAGKINDKKRMHLQSDRSTKLL